MGYGLRVAVAGLLLTLGACSSDGGEQARPPETTTATATSAPDTSSSPVAETTASSASNSTVQACRALADDEGLAEYWEKVAAGGADAPAAVAAANAIRGLEVYLPMPDVDATVLAAVKDATDAIAADGTLPARVEDFRATVTPIVDACLALEVDMEVK